MKRRHTIKELLEAQREAHRIIYEVLWNEVMPYRASALVMKFIRKHIDYYRRKGTPCQQDCDVKTRSEGSKPS